LGKFFMTWIPQEEELTASAAISSVLAKNTPVYCNRAGLRLQEQRWASSRFFMANTEGLAPTASTSINIKE
jgi:hypothetical protein